MKLNSRHRRKEQGIAVVVVLALLAILILYIGANLKSLRSVHQEIKLVEQRHLRHWQAKPVVGAAAAPISTNQTVSVP